MLCKKTKELIFVRIQKTYTYESFFFFVNRLRCEMHIFLAANKTLCGCVFFFFLEVKF